MEPTFVTINAVGKARRVTVGGREYLDVPMTSIVEGVLPGSKGPLYYHRDDIKADPKQWDGTTIVVYHPTHPQTGQPLSVDDPAVPSASKIGVLRNTRVRERDGQPVKLQHVGRFDVLKTQAYDAELVKQGRPPILPRIERGEPVELSTGLFTQNSPAPKGFTDYRGLPYSGMMAKQHRRDHLAVLPDQRGACSVSDGCGVLIDNANTTENCGGPGSGKPGPCGSQIAAAYHGAAKLDQAGVTAAHGLIDSAKKSDLHAALSEMGFGHLTTGSHSGTKLKKWAKEFISDRAGAAIRRTLLKPAHLQTNAEADLFDLAMNLTCNCGPGRPGPCKMHADTSLKTSDVFDHHPAMLASSKASKASEKAKRSDHFDDHAVAARLHSTAATHHEVELAKGDKGHLEAKDHKEMVSRHKERSAYHIGQLSHASDPTKVMNMRSETCVQNSDAADSATSDADAASEKANKSSSEDMAALHKKAVGDHLKAAAKHGKAAEVNSEDGDDHVAQDHMQKSAGHLRKAARHQEMAGIKGSNEVYNRLTTNQQPDGDFDMKKDEIVQWLTTNCGHFKDKKAMLDGLDEYVLAGMKGDAEKAMTANAAALVTNCGPKTLNEMLQAATPEEQAIWNTAKQVSLNERNRLVGLLTANMSAEQKTAATSMFDKMDVPQLTTLVSVLPQPKPVVNQDQPRQPIFAGSVVPTPAPTPTNNYDRKKNPLRIVTDEDVQEWVANEKKQSA